MDKKVKVVSYLAVMMAIVGGAALGISRLNPSIAHAQAPVTPTQLVSPAENKEVVDTNEPAGGTETKDSTKGHQDAGKSVDHQFEGIE